MVHSDEVKYICADKYLAYVEDLESRIDSVAACVQKQKDRLDVMGFPTTACNPTAHRVTHCLMESSS